MSSPRWLSRPSVCMVAVRWILASCGLAAQVRYATAQSYPPAPILKDGTAVVLQDLARLPLSSRTPDNFDYAFYPPAIALADPMRRVNFLQSEPTNAPCRQSDSSSAT